MLELDLALVLFLLLVDANATCLLLHERELVLLPFKRRALILPCCGNGSNNLVFFMDGGLSLVSLSLSLSLSLPSPRVSRLQKFERKLSLFFFRESLFFLSVSPFPSFFLLPSWIAYMARPITSRISRKIFERQVVSARPHHGLRHKSFLILRGKLRAEQVSIQIFH